MARIETEVLDFVDQEITCKCGNTFTLTAGEQAFYATKVDRETGMPLKAPKRCKPCRDARRLQKQEI